MIREDHGKRSSSVARPYARPGSARRPRRVAARAGHDPVECGGTAGDRDGRAEHPRRAGVVESTDKFEARRDGLLVQPVVLAGGARYPSHFPDPPATTQPRAQIPAAS